jgi:hypothetical protein
MVAPHSAWHVVSVWLVEPQAVSPLVKDARHDSAFGVLVGLAADRQHLKVNPVCPTQTFLFAFGVAHPSPLSAVARQQALS